MSDRMAVVVAHPDHVPPQIWTKPLERLGTVAIVGVGLIGGSVGLALRARGLADRVVGVGRDPARLDEAVRLGAIDTFATDIKRGVSDADVAVICTPVGRIAEDCLRAARCGPERLLVTDAGSTKRAIVSDIEADPVARDRFVAAHPIAGSERSGVGAASADLFRNRSCILTPTEVTPHDRLERASAFWASLGFRRVVEMTPEAHDEALARTSHLPHAVASAMAGCVREPWLSLTGGAYRDGTRVADSDGALWADIFLANQAPVLDALDEFDRRLGAFREALAARDRDALLTWWEDRPALSPSRGTRE